MKNQSAFDPRYVNNDPPPFGWRMANWRTSPPVSRHLIIASLLIVALIAFEIFNFDTTRFALSDFLGDVSFAGVSWAAILALAFCAIDFAGLARLFTPEKGEDEPKEVWYLMGAWLLGATMNAVMTWWAVSLTLLNHDFGNEVLGRAQLLKAVPIFVAVLVWLTRILFIGAVSVTGEKLLDLHRQERGFRPNPQPQPQAQPSALAATGVRPATRKQAPAPRTAAQIKERPASAPSRAGRSQPVGNNRPNAAPTAPVVRKTTRQNGPPTRGGQPTRGTVRNNVQARGRGG